MRKLALGVLVFGVLGLGLGTLAQFTPPEIQDYVKWEEFLKTAKVVGERQMSQSEGVTRPWVLTLEKDGFTAQAAWKNPMGMKGGYLESWKTEIAAYLLSKYLGLHMVPPTVEKEFRGDRGSCQMWVTYWKNFEDILNEKKNPPGPKVSGFYRALYLQRAFDNLIANEDRHRRNYLITEDWRMILIDHSRTFRTAKRYTTRLIYDEKFKEGPNFIMAQLPKAFVETLKALDFNVIKNVVGEYLTDEEIQTTLARRDLIIAWLDKRIKELGESQVLYEP
jgi:hypothetical protein